MCRRVAFEYQSTSGKHSVTLVSSSVCGWSSLIWHSELIHLAFIDRFNEFSNYNMLSEFKRNAINNGVKATSLNSYFKKIKAILNDAYDKGFIYTKFTLNKNLKSPVQSNEERIQTIDPEDFNEAISKVSSIYDCQALGLYLLMFGLRGMYQADIVALKDATPKKNNFDKKSV